jgi:DNA adenine methylase
MILRRLGNKQKIAKDIQKHFPLHRIYIEPFFGAGGMFFNKPKAKYNIVNDLDSDVFNLFNVVLNQKEDLKKAFYMMPIHSDLLNHWKENEETEPIKKALRFLFISNLTFMGAGSSLVYSATGKAKAIKDKFNERLNITFNMLYDCSFNSTDFREFIKNIEFQKDGRNDEEKTFIYCDPPYLGTMDNYSNSFKENDSIDLFNVLELRKCKFAMSEFNHPFILEQAKQRNLNVIVIGERKNLKNRKTEILITNYKNEPTLFS